MNNIENIWQTAKYLSNQVIKPSFSTIAGVKDSFGLQVIISEDIANVLLENFFPPYPLCPLPIANSSFSQISHIKQLPDILLTFEEVYMGIFRTFSLKGLGKDSFPALIWQKLWLVL